MQPRRKTSISLRADRERRRIFGQEILGGAEVALSPLPKLEASRELAKFSEALRAAPYLEGYFDRRHILNMKSHVEEARHGFAALAHGGILEVLTVPALPEEVMGFHIFTVYDPSDEKDQGKIVGYTVYSLEKGSAPFGQAEAVRMAFDIFREFREGRYRKVRFTNHEIYNISRKILYRFKPAQFLVDAATQICSTRTGNPFKRTIYYLKRGYYPPDRKGPADVCLALLLEGKPVSKRRLGELTRKSQAPFWIFPIKPR